MCPGGSLAACSHYLGDPRVQTPPGVSWARISTSLSTKGPLAPHRATLPGRESVDFARLKDPRGDDDLRRDDADEYDRVQALDCDPRPLHPPIAGWCPA